MEILLTAMKENEGEREENGRIGGINENGIIKNEGKLI